ncbi:MAG: WG repeat-containing protein [Deltaproteobacteria bacterium]|nr:WG repeat-containing protein [Deltaproteobacteria bacterium]
MDAQQALWGLVDRSGSLIARPTWREVGRFAEGRCPVFDGRGWGYVDERGALVVPCRYAGASPFVHGHGIVVRGDGEAGWAVTHDGRETRALRFARADGLVEIIDRPIVDDDAPDGVAGTRSWLLRDRVPAPGAPLGADRFAAPAAADGRVRLVDGRGRLVKEIDCLAIRPFVGGLARVTVHGGASFIRPDGTRLDATWEEADDLVEGLARVRLPDGGDGFIDAAGQVVIAGAGKRRTGALMRASSFAVGLAIVDVSGRKGLMDRQGNMVVAPRLARLAGPHGGRWYGEDELGRAVLYRPDGSPVPLDGRDPRPVATDEATAARTWVTLARDGKRGVVDGEGPWSRRSSTTRRWTAARCSACGARGRAPTARAAAGAPSIWPPVARPSPAASWRWARSGAPRSPPRAWRRATSRTITRSASTAWRRTRATVTSARGASRSWTSPTSARGSPSRRCSRRAASSRRRGASASRWSLGARGPRSATRPRASRRCTRSPRSRRSCSSRRARARADRRGRPGRCGSARVPCRGRASGSARPCGRSSEIRQCA